MEKGRKIKILSIMALVVSIIGMTLGFAAFSSTLTISSSARVTPNASDFNFVVYGIGDDVEYEVIGYDIPLDSTLYSSTVSSKPFTFNKVTDIVSAEAKTAIINGTKITNLNAEFTNPDQAVLYAFLIKNDGRYDAYLNTLDHLSLFSGINKMCEAAEGTTESLVEEVCQYIRMTLIPMGSTSNEILFAGAGDSFKISPGEYIRVAILIDISGTPDNLADGPFTVKFQDIDFVFTTTPKGNVLNP